MMQPINYLKNRITLDAIPFTERNSRMMIFRQGDEFQIKLAESWSEDEALTFVTWHFLDAEGQVLETNIVTQAHCVNIATGIGQFALAFADPETLMIQLPSQACGLRLTVVGNNVQQDRLGAVIDYHDKMPIHLSYTSNAHFSKHTITAIETSLGFLITIDWI